MAELSIPDGSEYVGKTIQEAGLREKDINVLTLHRDTTVIPNPKPTRMLEAGDRLLCFGKLESMRDMISDRTKRARQLRVRKLKGELEDKQIKSEPEHPSSEPTSATDRDRH